MAVREATRRIGPKGEQGGMDTPSPLTLASMILTAPGWVRVGITAPVERIRQEAALELATVIVAGMDKSAVTVPDGQMALPL